MLGQLNKLKEDLKKSQDSINEYKEKEKKHKINEDDEENAAVAAASYFISM